MTKKVQALLAVTSVLTVAIITFMVVVSFTSEAEGRTDVAGTSTMQGVALEPPRNLDPNDDDLYVDFSSKERPGERHYARVPESCGDTINAGSEITVYILTPNASGITYAKPMNRVYNKLPKVLCKEKRRLP